MQTLCLFWVVYLFLNLRQCCITNCTRIFEIISYHWFFKYFSFQLDYIITVTIQEINMTSRRFWQTSTVFNLSNSMTAYRFHGTVINRNYTFNTWRWLIRSLNSCRQIIFMSRRNTSISRNSLHNSPITKKNISQRIWKCLFNLCE